MPFKCIVPAQRFRQPIKPFTWICYEPLKITISLLKQVLLLLLLFLNVPYSRNWKCNDHWLNCSSQKLQHYFWDTPSLTPVYNHLPSPVVSIEYISTTLHSHCYYPSPYLTWWKKVPSDILNIFSFSSSSYNSQYSMSHIQTWLSLYCLQSFHVQNSNDLTLLLSLISFHIFPDNLPFNYAEFLSVLWVIQIILLIGCCTNIFFT